MYSVHIILYCIKIKCKHSDRRVPVLKPYILIVAAAIRFVFVVSFSTNAYKIRYNISNNVDRTQTDAERARTREFIEVVFPLCQTVNYSYAYYKDSIL